MHFMHSSLQNSKAKYFILCYMLGRKLYNLNTVNTAIHQKLLATNLSHLTNIGDIKLWNIHIKMA